MIGVEVGLGSLSRGDQSRTWQVTNRDLGRRLDAEPRTPPYRRYDELIRDWDCATRLDEVAILKKPFGRNRVVYVDEPSLGVPLLSGRQVGQYRLVCIGVVSTEVIDGSA